MDDTLRVVEVPMRFRTWPVAALALGALLLLVVAAVLESSRRAQDIYTRLDRLNERYHQVEGKLRRLRSNVNLSGIFVRDYLLDPEREHAPEYQKRIVEFRQRSAAEFGELQALLAGRGEVADRLPGLRARLDEYWQALDPLFSWSETERTKATSGFLRTEVLPRREAVLAITSEIENLNNASMAAQRVEVAQQQAQLRADLYTLLWPTLLLGVIVAMTAVYRLRRLERRSEDQRAQAEAAERELRQLSQQLVATQEEERTKISRELHDHVGQMLTALRMELGTIDRLRSPSDEPIRHAVAEGRELVDTVVRSVRDLALGLRPSMLDDLGLQPALEWLVRDFTRRYDLPVLLKVSGDLSLLPDQHRTCVYRVIQEALTNCARHANASSIRISLERQSDSLEVKVVDDGTGFDVARRRGGFGLHGIEERARELGGESSVRSVKGAGTSLRILLPLSAAVGNEETPFARAAG